MLKVNKYTKFPGVQDALNIIDGFHKVHIYEDGAWAFAINNIKKSVCENFINSTLDLCVPTDKPWRMKDDDIFVIKIDWATDIGEEITNVCIAKKLNPEIYLIIEIHKSGGSDIVDSSGEVKRNMDMIAYVSTFNNYNALSARFHNKGKTFIMNNTDLLKLFEYVVKNNQNICNNTPDDSTYNTVISLIS